MPDSDYQPELDDQRMAAVRQAITDFNFHDYGLDDVDPHSEYAEWVGDLASAITGALPELSPAPVDRAAVLREAADVADDEARHLYDDMGQKAATGARLVGDRLRRMADEAQQPEEAHVVADSSDDPEHVDDCPGCPAP